MVSRVYVEKKPGFDVEAQQLLAELRDTLGIEALTGLRVINRYDVEGIDGELFGSCVPTVFSEPQVDFAYDELPEEPGATVFAVEALPGQFDQRAASAAECVQLISCGERPTVRSAKVYLLSGDLSTEDFDAIKGYVVNPVESRLASLDFLTGHRKVTLIQFYHPFQCIPCIPVAHRPAEFVYHRPYRFVTLQS